MSVDEPEPPRASAPRAAPFRRLSLGQKLAATAAAAIMLVGVSISLASYYEVRSAAIDDTNRRVKEISDLVGTSIRSGNQLTAPVEAIAKRPGIVDLGADPDAPHQVAALQAMLTRTGNGTPLLLDTQILDSTGQVVLSTHPRLHPDWTDFPPRVAHDSTVSVGRMRMINGQIVYPLSARIPGPERRVLVQWRPAVNPRMANQALRQLIGADIVLAVGNRDGSYWSNYQTIVPRPPVRLDTTQVPVSYQRDGKIGPVTSGILVLDGTPFALAIEFPLREVLAGSDAFFRRMLAVTLLCVAIGVLLAWWLGRRLVAPLASLTDAADSIARGHGLAETGAHQGDEIARLASSFHGMSQQVSESRQQLESKVRDRTAELDTALKALQETQEALVRREKLAMLGQLAGSVGHELRNPLGVMSNAIYYLDMVLQPATPDVRDYLRLLREQVGLSTKIVGDLLDSARVNPAQRRAVSVHDVVQTQTERLEPRPDVRIETNFGAQAPTAEVDPVQLGQIVFNLLTNAVQAMGDGGGVVTIAAHDAGDQVIELRISDTGPGVAEGDREKIFEPLYTTKARGIGLGLAVSRALARANLGDLQVDGTPGRGATFIVTMPATVGAAP